MKKISCSIHVFFIFFIVLSNCNTPAFATHAIKLKAVSGQVALAVGKTNYHFIQKSKKWEFSHVSIGKAKMITALDSSSGFFLGGGTAAEFTIVEQNKKRIEICFSRLSNYPDAKIYYWVEADDPLPRIYIKIDGVDSPSCIYRSIRTDAQPRGSWITRGETRTDAENKEVYIDGSGPFVFGHSVVGNDDISYVWQAMVNPNVPPTRTEQKTDTYFRSGINKANPAKPYTYWQLRMGKNEPKTYAIIWDKNLGGRVHKVCEKYFSDIIDSQIDIRNFPATFDSQKAIEKLPVRLSAPESLIPGYGWEMKEYYPNGENSSYPYGHDSGIQTGALLAYQGLATQREWEKNFGLYVLSQMPLWDDGHHGFFVKRAGGYSRWSYFSDYKYQLPFLEGGNWSSSEQLYYTALLSNDKDLKEKAVSLMKHDIHVKLDMENYYFPPCWNPDKNELTDHRDDWMITSGLGYCAVVCAEILYPETKDSQYIEIADKITDWLASFWKPETKMNFLHPGVNSLHCFSGWLIKAMIQRYERCNDVFFLDIAKDLTWSIIMTNCITAHRYNNNSPLFAITCVGARGCIDYDCTPHLCHEKDLVFIEMMGALMKYAKGSGYAKYLSMQAYQLPRDSWSHAWQQDQRDLNLRTNYDNWARGMTNLAFGLNYSPDPYIQVFDRGVSNKSLKINTQRDFIVGNATADVRTTVVKVPYLNPGIYRVSRDEGKRVEFSWKELADGFPIQMAANTTASFAIRQVRELPEDHAAGFAAETISLTEFPPVDAQRGTGGIQPIFKVNQTFSGNPILIEGKKYETGLGFTTNTVLVYHLEGKYRTLSALLAMDDHTKSLKNPQPSVRVTLFADGKLGFDSESFTVADKPLPVNIDLTGINILTIRISGNFDDSGNSTNDFVNMVNPILKP